MKNYLMKCTAIVLAFLSFACSTDDNNNNNNNNNNNLKSIAEIASATPDLSTLVAALDKAGLVSTFSNPGDYTVFAPTNDQFQEYLTANGYANLEAVPVDELREILKNHVIGESLLSTDLETGYVKTLAKGAASSTNTLSMYIDLTSGVKINGGPENGGANVVLESANILASNGVIHIVDNIITLPNIVNHAIANPNFTSLIEAMIGESQPDFEGILNGNGPFTVFAPTNAAFTSLNVELASEGIVLNPSDITNTLYYHVITTPANVLAASLTEGQILTPILQPAQTFTVLRTGGVRIKDARNRECPIVETDVQGTNGVIHALSKVLLPTF